MAARAVVVGPGSRMAAAGLAAATFVSSFLYPALLQACPVCAGRNDQGGTTRGILLALIIFFPFALVFAVIRFMRSRTTEAWSAAAPFVRPESEDRPSRESGVTRKVRNALP